MEYTPILKQAASIMWKHKVLWVLSFFATGSIYNIYLIFPTTAFGPEMDIQGLEAMFAENLFLILGASFAALLLFITFWVLSFAAQGGLVRLVADADSGVAVRGLAGWKTGFRLLGRIFLLAIVLFVPYAVVAAVVTGLIAAPLLLVGMEEDLSGPFLVFCGGMMIGGPLLIAGGILLDMLSHLGLRHIVLGDLSVIRSIGQAWRDLRARFKDVVVMWLLLFVIGIIVWGIMTSGTVLLETIQIFVTQFSFWGAIAVGFLDFLLLTAGAVIWWSFHSGAWTLFFRRAELSAEPTQSVAAPSPLPFAETPAPVNPAPAPTIDG